MNGTMPDALSNALPTALMVLCHADGRIARADREAILLLGNSGGSETSSATLSQIAAKINCGQLTTLFEGFAAGEQAFTKAVTVCDGSDCEVLLRRLNGFQSQPLIAVEMNLQPPPLAEQGQTALLEVGRATNRLIHDFKNQMSGLKLYAAYLKKRFADRPEGVEIAEKIIQSLNEMTENASLIGKLTRPIELKLLEEDFVALIKQVVQNLQPQAAGRNVEVASTFAVAAFRLPLDSQQMRMALNPLLAQAIESSHAGGTVNVGVQAGQNELLVSISDEGGAFSEEQRQSFFNFLTNERLNKTSLGLALARRIIEAHGGTVEALAVQPTGKTISIKFGN
jgi:signal transduction histidine kinase